MPPKEKQKDKRSRSKDDYQLSLLGPLESLFGKFEELELENITIDVDELTLFVRPALEQIAEAVRPTALLDAKFKSPYTDYPGEIREITIGATKADGGSRGKTLTIGGHKAPAWNLFQAKPERLPIIAADVFDMRIPLAKVVRAHYNDVMDDPCDWARLVVDKFGEDLITLHIISTDPALKDTSINEAAKTIENVLQAVDVPILIGGSGDP